MATKHRAGDRTKGSIGFGQEGSSAKPGSNLRGRSALEHDGNHFSQETKEPIPSGGTERSTQVMEPAPGDEGIGLRALRTDWTVTRQSERSGRAVRGRKDVLAADLYEEQKAYRRKSRATATEGRCARVEHARRKVSANTADSRVGIPRVGEHARDQRSARKPFNQSWQCPLNTRSARRAWEQPPQEREEIRPSSHVPVSDHRSQGSDQTTTLHVSGARMDGRPHVDFTAPSVRERRRVRDPRAGCHRNWRRSLMRRTTTRTTSVEAPSNDPKTNCRSGVIPASLR